MSHPLLSGASWSRSNLWAEGVRVSLENLGDGLLADVLVFNVVAAPIAIAVLAILSTGEALTIELETSRVFAVAILLLLSTTLVTVRRPSARYLWSLSKTNRHKV